MARRWARAELAALALADPPGQWEALGFAVEADRLRLGEVTLVLGRPGTGIVGWDLRGLRDRIDGLPAFSSPWPASPPVEPAPTEHPNGALGVDHVVVLTPDFTRTSAALETAGMALRRVVSRPDGRRMGFRRLGPTVLELVESDEVGAGPARFWGFVVVVSDLEALALRLGRHLGSIRPAVQPGRRIATLRSSAGMQEAVAFMDDEVSGLQV